MPRAAQLFMPAVSAASGREAAWRGSAHLGFVSQLLLQYFQLLHAFQPLHFQLVTFCLPAGLLGQQLFQAVFGIRLVQTVVGQLLFNGG